MKYLLAMAFCSGLNAHQGEKLKEWLHEEISQYEAYKTGLTDSSDIYTAYYVCGKQEAYREVLKKLEENSWTGVESTD